MIRKAALLSSASLLSFPTFAGTIVNWDFKSSGVPTQGAGSYQSTGGTTLTLSGSGLGISNFPVQSTNDKTGGLDIKFATTGFKDIQISFAAFALDAGAPNWLAIQYSTDGTNFFDTDEPAIAYATNEAYYPGFLDLPDVANNASELTIRFVAQFSTSGGYDPVSPSGATYDPNATIAFSSFQATGNAVTVVPLPPAILAGAALMAMLPAGKKLRDLKLRKHS